ncbi:hypothetical protein BJ508DRAFT_418947 [Ascobolus immersus RN42]|uniref:Programmed cell death protein 2 C-terminal domain-containing protein n=1 Tax=Ascobolus immersus RN42 TaxID=1160509 RepID=A0A3N4HHZ5_ASCIM|nr:hypothetical protein BJ508DRAFT_418947 [Ascobolus immersus RN42]
MAPYDSDSDFEDDDMNSVKSTPVLLGYAEEEPLPDDSVSQLGGIPTWLTPTSPADPRLAKCKSCNTIMTQLLQLDAKLPNVPGERMIWVWTCLQRRCRRQEGSIRAFRGVRVTEKEKEAHKRKAEQQAKKDSGETKQVDMKEAPRMGDMVFGAGGLGSGAAKSNPFSSGGGQGGMFGGGAFGGNPFATKPAASATPPAPTTPAAEPEKKEEEVKTEEKKTDSLPATFAQKLCINLPPPAADKPEAQDPAFFGPAPPWPAEFPNPFPKYYLDADYETLEKENLEKYNLPANYSIEDDSFAAGSSKNVDDGKEGELDVHFQKFADRVAQNPEQVLRYYGHPPCMDPIFYSKKDEIYKRFNGKTKKGVPKCTVCGKKREVELQLMPYAIMALERDEVGLDGMEWGTVIVGCCDCVPWTRVDGEGVWYGEEWCGVQWEERK